MPSRKTTDLKLPSKKSGDKDKRYTTPQFCKSDGTRDKRTKNTRDRK
jgi:hypothetical protein